MGEWENGKMGKPTFAEASVDNWENEENGDIDVRAG